MSVRRKSSSRAPILQVHGEERRSVMDWITTEEPLEIRVVHAGGAPPGVPVTVTMRTPGHDFELAVGFLTTEGIIRDRHDVNRISYCVGEQDGEQQYNIVNVWLRPGARWNPDEHRRHFPATSACGVCGKASLETLLKRVDRRPAGGIEVDPMLVRSLPERLREAQQIFAQTGGLHAAALVDRAGTVCAVREDIGRHNAVDKLLGYAVLHGLDLSRLLLMVSSRVGYEIVQKAAVAGLPMLAAISAPSSLAVDLARAVGITLIGFIRSERFNVYAGAERLAVSGHVRAEEGAV